MTQTLVLVCCVWIQKDLYLAQKSDCKVCEKCLLLTSIPNCLKIFLTIDLRLDLILQEYIEQIKIYPYQGTSSISQRLACPFFLMSCHPYYLCMQLSWCCHSLHKHDIFCVEKRKLVEHRRQPIAQDN